jgi:hypothetical protein
VKERAVRQATMLSQCNIACKAAVMACYGWLSHAECTPHICRVGANLLSQSRVGLQLTLIVKCTCWSQQPCTAASRVHVCARGLLFSSVGACMCCCQRGHVICKRLAESAAAPQSMLLQPAWSR